MIKYQVFVSSTYQDLIEERKEVIQALLELDCIPVGMELFPATDDSQWNLIKELIDDCDYYILIIGGRYGSLNKDGISYTQMEYEYATKIGVPTISFLPKSPDDITLSKTDKDPEKGKKLEEFKKLVSEKMIKFWSNSEELGSVVSRSLVKLIKTKPRTGWVKADKISNDEANLEILKLKQTIQVLEEELKISANKDLYDLSQGDDVFEFNYSFRKSAYSSILERGYINMTWDELFSKTCSMLIGEACESDYQQKVSSYVKFLVEKKNIKVYSINIIQNDFSSILIQFRALGLIEKSIKNRSVKDTNTYWKLTSKGDDLIMRLRALRKSINDNLSIKS